MKDEQRNYLIVGTFVIAMVIGLVAWIALLAGRTGATDPFYIEFQNVMGLSEGTQIYFDGYPVGLIEDIGPREDGFGYRVEVSVKRGWPIPDDSVARIQQGLLSAVVVDIRSGTSPRKLEPGARIPSQEAPDVFAAIASVAGRIDELMEQSVKPMLENLSEGIPTIVDDLSEFTEQLNVTLVRIQEILDPENTERLERILTNVDSTASNIAGAASGLRRTQQGLDQVIGRVDAMLDEDSGELGHAIQDLHHTLESVAQHIDAINYNLETAARNMSEFSGQLRSDPSVLIRGRDADADDGASR